MEKGEGGEDSIAGKFDVHVAGICEKFNIPALSISLSQVSFLFSPNFLVNAGFEVIMI